MTQLIRKRSLISMILSVCLIFGVMGTAFGAGSVKDIKGHWAESQITDWLNKGLINGYKDGTFKPNASITRAEFVTLVNRSFGLTDKANIGFKDTKAGAWYYGDVQIAASAGYIQGYEDNSFRPNKTISRQEIAAIIARLLNLDSTTAPDTKFTDAASISSWSKGYVNAVVAKGIMQGNPNNTFLPFGFTTRAETVVALDKALSAQGTSYNVAGTYGPATGTQTITGNVSVNAAGVTLQNLIITGDLDLGAGIGNGDVTLKNVTVQGKTTVRGGGENSIHFVDSKLTTVTVNKASGNVRVTAEGTTVVPTVIVQSPVKLEELNLTGAGFQNVTLSNLLAKDSVVTLIGTFDTVTVEAASIKLEVKGTITNLIGTAGATNLILVLNEGSHVITLTLEVPAKVQGKGKIDTAILSAAAKAGTTFETQPGTIQDKGVTPPTGGGGWGGGGDVTPPVIQNSALTLKDNGLNLNFSVSEAVYLGTNINDKGNIKIQYYIKNQDGTTQELLNSNGTPLALDKNNSGYLQDSAGKKYGQGTPANMSFDNNVPAATNLLSVVGAAYVKSSVSATTYDAIDWSVAHDYVAQILVTDNAGNTSAPQTVNYSVNALSDASLSASTSGLQVKFSVNQAVYLDLNKDSNIKIELFKKSGNDWIQLTKDSTGTALVLDKHNPGYLKDSVSGVTYGTASVSGSTYSNYVPANTKLLSVVTSAYEQSVSGTTYHAVDWSASATYVAKISLFDTNGKLAGYKIVEFAYQGALGVVNNTPVVAAATFSYANPAAITVLAPAFKPSLRV